MLDKKRLISSKDIETGEHKALYEIKGQGKTKYLVEWHWSSCSGHINSKIMLKKCKANRLYESIELNSCKECA